MKTFRADPGETYFRAASRAATAVAEAGEPMKFVFNDIEVACEPGDTGEAIADRWADAVDEFRRIDERTAVSSIEQICVMPQAKDFVMRLRGLHYESPEILRIVSAAKAAWLIN